MDRWDRLGRVAVVAILCICAVVGTARADDPALQSRRDAAFTAAKAALKTGPADIPLGDVATLHLPQGMGFVPKREAAAIAKLFGNDPGDKFLGWIVPLGEGEWRGWLAYNDAGHVSEDDAKSWNADELLKNLKEGTESENEARAKVGVPAIEVTRWIEVPRYDNSTHRLVWSAEVGRKERHPGDTTSANYNTFVLGRTGYVSLDFVTDEQRVEAEKPIARDLLAQIDFRDGQRYGQFNASTDKIAEFGLAALVGGVVAKKIGLLAVIAAFLAKFAKLSIIAVIAFWKRIRNFFMRLFGKTPEEPVEASAPATPAPDQAGSASAAAEPPADAGRPGT